MNGFRIRTARALGLLRDMRAITPLIEALNDREEWVRYNAAWSLSEFGDKQALQPLVKQLKLDPSPNARRGAAEALGKIGDESVVEELVSALTDPADIVIEAIDQALQRLGYAID